MKIIQYLFIFIKKLLIFLHVGLRPLLGPANCKFTISCGVYAENQLKQQPTHKAFINIIKRLFSCNPFW